MVMEAFEGDMVRPLGFVTLYFAYAEAQVDEVLKTLGQVTGVSESKAQSVGMKVGEALKAVEGIGGEKLPGLALVLKDARVLIEARNELIHGQLFNGGRLVSRNGDRKVTSKEIEELAERIFNWKERLWERYWRELVPLASKLEAGTGLTEPGDRDAITKA